MCLDQSEKGLLSSLINAIIITHVCQYLLQLGFKWSNTIFSPIYITILAEKVKLPFSIARYEDIIEEKMGLSTELMAMVKAGAAMEVVKTMMKNVSTEPVWEWWRVANALVSVS